LQKTPALSDEANNRVREAAAQKLYEAVEVRAHHVEHAAGLSRVPQFVGRRFFRSPCFAEHFDSNRDSKLVPEFETVGRKPFSNRV